MGLGSTRFPRLVKQRTHLAIVLGPSDLVAPGEIAEEAPWAQDSALAHGTMNQTQEEVTAGVGNSSSYPTEAKERERERERGQERRVPQNLDKR